MATRIHSGQKRARAGGDLGPTITAFLRDAAAGRAVDPAGKPYTPAGLRSLERIGRGVPGEAHEQARSGQRGSEGEPLLERRTRPLGRGMGAALRGAQARARSRPARRRPR